MKSVKVDIVGLSEVRRKMEDALMVDDADGPVGVLYHSGRLLNSQAGVGFFVSGRCSSLVSQFVVCSPRICFLDVNIGRDILVRILQCYAPPSSRPDDEYDDFMTDLEAAYAIAIPHRRRFKKTLKLVIGDFNCRVGQRGGWETSVGQFCLGIRNDKGEALVTS